MYVLEEFIVGDALHIIGNEVMITKSKAIV